MFRRKKSIIIALVIGIVIGFGFALKGAQDNGKKLFSKTTSSLEVVSFITPHHLVAEKLIDDVFIQAGKMINQSQIERIVLVSPNHSNLGSASVFVSNKSWPVGKENIIVDNLAVSELEKLAFVVLDNDAFADEHGIRNILPYVQKYFPQKPIVNLMIREGMEPEELDRLAQSIPSKSVMILSSDFSHELEKNISQLHDKKAIRTISNFDYGDVFNLDSDCHSGLYLIMKYSQLAGFGRFNLIGNSNSSKIFGKDFIGQNTSYVTGYFSKGEKKSIEPGVNMLFTGDLMLDRQNRYLLEKKGFNWPLEKISRLFWSQDVNLANLEGVVSDNQSFYRPDNLWDDTVLRFTFDPEKTDKLLKRNHFNVLNLGNNHMDDFGNQGANQTMENLDRSNIFYFGDIGAKDINSKVYSVGGKKIGLVSFNQFGGEIASQISTRIKELKPKVDFLIVYTHWGTEYALVENGSQKKTAHDFVDAGADLIVGSHPHVVQPVEVYKNKAIFYSLGNFIFDQYFSEDTKNMLALGLLASQGKLEFYLVPLYLEPNGQVVLADEKTKSGLISRITNDPSLSVDLRDQITKEGYFRLED